MLEAGVDFGNVDMNWFEPQAKRVTFSPDK